jgi:hypothetical protein
MAKVVKITGKGIMLTEGSGHKEVKLPNGKILKTYHGGKLGFLICYNVAELGIEVGKDFPIPVTFTAEKVKDATTKEELPFVWCKL